jgi:hypothetical protein
MSWSLFQSLKRHRRTATAACGILAVLVVTLITFWPTSLEERVNRIQPEMTVAEVEETMGLPPGDYSGGLRAKIRRVGSTGGDDCLQTWYWDDATVTVWFNPGGGVIRTEYRPHPRSLSERIQLWFE